MTFQKDDWQDLGQNEPGVERNTGEKDVNLSQTWQVVRQLESGVSVKGEMLFFLFNRTNVPE